MTKILLLVFLITSCSSNQSFIYVEATQKIDHEIEVSVYLKNKQIRHRFFSVEKSMIDTKIHFNESEPQPELEFLANGDWSLDLIKGDDFFVSDSMIYKSNNSFEYQISIVNRGSFEDKFLFYIDQPGIYKSNKYDQLQINVKIKP